MKRFASVLCSLLPVALLIAGCSNTSIRGQWKDPGFSTPAHSVLVVGLPPNSMIGNMCTDEFVRQLTGRGIPATAAYSDPPSGYSRAAMAAKARALGRDGVVVCRYLERKQRLDVYPNEDRSMFFDRGWELWPPNEYVENEYDVFRTVVLEGAAGKAVWSAVSETFAPGSEQKVLKSYVKAMLKEMEKDGVLAKPGH
ncbi:hypothetical protein GMSM_03800 [Geomonas sp. Red276]